MITLRSSNHNAVTPLEDILHELARSIDKHPRYPKRHERRALILGEESGEVLKEVLDATRIGSEREDDDSRIADPPELFPHKVYDELVQTAAMALKFMIALREEYPVT